MHQKTQESGLLPSNKQWRGWQPDFKGGKGKFNVAALAAAGGQLATLQALQGLQGPGGQFCMLTERRQTAGKGPAVLACPEWPNLVCPECTSQPAADELSCYMPPRAAIWEQPGKKHATRMPRVKPAEWKKLTNADNRFAGLVADADKAVVSNGTVEASSRGDERISSTGVSVGHSLGVQGSGDCKDKGSRSSKPSRSDQTKFVPMTQI